MARTLAELYREATQKHDEATKVNHGALLQDALHQYQLILNQTPHEDVVLFQIATVMHQMGYNGMAVRLYEALSPSHEDRPELWNNLGNAWKGMNDNKKAEQYFRKALAMCPGRTEYYNNLATLHVNEGTPREGLRYVEQSLRIDPDNVKAHWNYALLLLETQQWEQGFKEYDCGILGYDRPNKFYDEDPKRVPYYFGAEGQDLDGKLLVIYGEQGIGDEMMYLSALWDFLAQHPTTTVILDCHDRLEGVIKRSFPDLEVHPTRKDLHSVPEWLDGRVPDYRMGIASIFRHTRLDGVFPRQAYLQPNPDLVKHYRDKLAELGPGPYIGLGWAGGAQKTHGHTRSFKLTPLKPIMDMGGTFVSLQYTAEAKEKLERHYQNTGVKIHHWPETIQAWLDEPTCKEKSPGYDYDHTLALLAALDVAIIPNTTAAHACGAIGAEAMVLTPDACAWRYRGLPDEMVFYGPWVKLYRENGNWGKAIERLVADCLARFDSNNEAAEG